MIKSEPVLSAAKVEKLNDLYGLSNSTNYYILVPFTRLGLAAKWEPSVERAVVSVGSDPPFLF